ncbi:hypothetical protein HEAR1120 [Herminiimonas arsenicoxydans]|uniref:Uncharacterized protein n=1 Tax=Herminiimonas arsenicoxydans TaxID=204773 RepID=A4G462_HERAR|nr:hypothetical protein HEAR1120 [Herminiimonas arsenicoxydans]
MTLIFTFTVKIHNQGTGNSRLIRHFLTEILKQRGASQKLEVCNLERLGGKIKHSHNMS